ncbi:YdcF family protein [Gordonia aquimaris]|uniref:YdcF family protein n=1 Tax=Gordonia aquimaris TaxID=2984863 RepID=A0A9X3D134_9ACTN|nr:YdcF family protein [Gordonia aquimaris]MCX2963069.1 YdcF family protein [Gordonia aquimaris]
MRATTVLVRGPNRRRRRRQALLAAAVCMVLVATLVVGVLGYQLFTRDHSDPLRPADAIVVLGGEHDGREDYGLELAAQGYADTVLISDPYRPYQPSERELMNRVCDASTDTIEVICFAPQPSTTRGEAMFTQQMATARGWRSVIVVSWRYHLVRARYIFGQCSDRQVIMRGVPRSYARSPESWAYTYAYQYGGLMKATLLGCNA